jgi:hypothetical protein
MALGFNSPQILFLNTWDEPERSYLYPIFQALRARGYTRFVEPCAGSFVMPSIAAEGGWPRADMEMSDVSLFSAMLGHTFAGKPLDDLDIRVDGEPIVIDRTAPISRQAADVLYQQLCLRMAQRTDAPYWNELRLDLKLRQDEHIDAIESHLKKLDARMHGVTFAPRDVWEHVESVADDPHAVISINPPTYCGGFEKFYDTDGRLTWATPEYEMFDAQTDVFKLMDLMKGRAALILCQQQQTPGNAAEFPVYARHLSPGQYVYVCTNRPAEVLAIAGGMKVVPLKPVELCRLDVPTLPINYEVSPESVLEVCPIGAKETAYYRDLWMHKLDGKQATNHAAVTVDGFLAGLIAYSNSSILRQYPGLPPERHGSLTLSFAVGAPHKDRMTRLVTMVALARETVELLMPPHLNAMTRFIVTLEMTRYPEAKGLRGLMKLESRTPDKKYGNRLIYLTEPTKLTRPQIVAEWVRKEQMWRRERAKQKPPAPTTA